MKLTQTGQFKKDVKRQTKRGRNLTRLKEVVALLIAGPVLPLKNRDHPLTGNWQGWRDCHIEPDWVLIYQRKPGELILGRTGTHADLF